MSEEIGIGLIASIRNYPAVLEKEEMPTITEGPFENALESE